MSPINFTNAFYIKLGRGGVWENDSIETGKLRLGWKEQSLGDINAGHWTVIEEQLRAKDQGKLIPATTSDLNALKIIATSGPEDIWITFHKSKLWWTRLAHGAVKKDAVSKFRLTSQPWNDKAADGRLFVVNQLPGKLSQIQGFRATVCRVKCAELLERTLNGTRSSLATTIGDHRKALAKQLTEAIKELHWKDFETLVDLVFRAAGWVRVSILGQHEKAYDLVLREPITGDRFVVQIKSRAGIADLDDTVSKFSAEDFRRIFFVVHSPEKDLAAGSQTLPPHVEIVGPYRLGELAMDAGLAGWLETKVS
jgi:Restriction endonuclease